jgi:hypothetical protein
MRASQIFVVLFFFFTLSNALYAGQSKEDEGKDTVSEPDCNYTSATHSRVVKKLIRVEISTS